VIEEQKREVKTMTDCAKEERQRNNESRQTTTEEHGGIPGWQTQPTKKKRKGWLEKRTKILRKEENGLLREAEPSNAQLQGTVQISAVRVTKVRARTAQLQTFCPDELLVLRQLHD
jgi:hypothetical protein